MGNSEKTGNSDRKIKSFVLRGGRMTAGQQRAWDELAGTFCISPETKTDFNSFFPSSAELYLEIGFGTGEATWQIAAANPDKNYLGIEVFPPGIGKLLSEIRDRDIKNLRIIRGDAVEILNNNADDSIFNGIHIFFPDPWQKKRHNKRRLLKPDFIRLCAQKLKQGAYLYVVSDWQEYADEILANLEKEPLLANKYKEFAEPVSWRPQTKFEHKGKNKQHRINEMFFVKK